MGFSLWRLLKEISLAAVLVQYGAEGQTSSKSTATSKTISSQSTIITGSPFQGFAIADAMTTPVSCLGGEVFVTSGKYAACCATTASSCAIATACKRNAVVYQGGKTSDCGPLQCHLREIFSKYGDEEPAFTQPRCAGIEEIDTLYQSVPMTSRLVLPLVAADATTTAADGSPIETGLPAPTTPTAVNGNSPSSNLSFTILGAVLGSVGALALIIFAFWFGQKQGISKSGKSAYEMKTLSETQVSGSTSATSFGGDMRLGPSNISGPSAIAATHST
ncbi:hypothetical protein F4806DRAFT_53156 [Annulohypoxylon nitens]|nr:hypothetical protein F4806DRAFT_53156 [Annulohypoxylon nitens]